MIVMIDNYDSFTYNLVQYLGELGEDVEVFRNDETDAGRIRALAPSAIVISPGPCTPNEAGISMAVVEELGGEIPILGVCLGHQSIGQVYGGDVVKSPCVMHGKTSLVHHNGEGLFEGIESPFTATRYHSLIVAKETLPDCLEVTAWTMSEEGEKDEIMAVRHKDKAVSGVQFHPESVLTEHGRRLLGNFLTMRG